MKISKYMVFTLLCTLSFTSLKQTGMNQALAYDTTDSYYNIENLSSNQEEGICKKTSDTELIEKVNQEIEKFIRQARLQKNLMKAATASKSKSVNSLKSAQLKPTIETNSDYAGMVDFPIIAKVNEPLTISVKNINEHYMVLLYGSKGDASSENSMTPMFILGDSLTGNEHEFTWVPELPGIFYVTVIDRYGKAIEGATRKVYVNGADSSHYIQLGDISLNLNAENNVQISAQLFDAPLIHQPVGWYGLNWPVVNLSIGEDMFWRKTVKTTDAKPYSQNRGVRYSFTENKDGFRLLSGNYQFLIGAKGEHSVENEDSKILYYDKEYDEALLLQITCEEKEDNITLHATAWIVLTKNRIKAFSHSTAIWLILRQSL